MVLHAGNLFDMTHPSLMTHSIATRELKPRITGPPPQFEVLRQPAHQAPLNLENPPVRLPILAINGTHDAWSGREHISVLDCFHSAGFLSYVGKVLDPEQVVISPYSF